MATPAAAAAERETGTFEPTARLSTTVTASSLLVLAHRLVRVRSPDSVIYGLAFGKCWPRVAGFLRSDSRTPTEADARRHV